MFEIAQNKDVAVAECMNLSVGHLHWDITFLDYLRLGGGYTSRVIHPIKT